MYFELWLRTYDSGNPSALVAHHVVLGAEQIGRLQLNCAEDAEVVRHALLGTLQTIGQVFGSISKQRYETVKDFAARVEKARLTLASDIHVSDELTFQKIYPEAGPS